MHAPWTYLVRILDSLRLSTTAIYTRALLHWECHTGPVLADDAPALVRRDISTGVELSTVNTGFCSLILTDF